MSMLNNFLTGLNRLIFPNNCLLCKTYIKNEDPSVLCKKCSLMIEVNRPPFCQKCSRRLNVNSQTNLCARCTNTEYFFDRSIATTIYNDTMKNLIHLFKYRQKLMLRRTFTQIMMDFIDNYDINLNNFDTIMPIPLHSSRMRERGYNQSQLMVNDLADLFKIEKSRDNLVRIRPTRNQALLKKKERWTNISGAFKIMNPSRIKGRSVVLVDDLFTTGATVSEAAHVLKDAGGSKIMVLTLAMAN